MVKKSLCIALLALTTLSSSAQKKEWIIKGEWAFELSDFNLKIIILLPLSKQVYKSRTATQSRSVAIDLDLCFPIEVV